MVLYCHILPYPLATTPFTDQFSNSVRVEFLTLPNNRITASLASPTLYLFILGDWRGGRKGTEL